MAVSTANQSLFLSSNGEKTTSGRDKEEEEVDEAGMVVNMLQGRDEEGGDKGEEEGMGGQDERLEASQGIQRTLALMLETLPDRLEDGRTPLPVLHKELYGGTKISVTMHPVAPSLEEQFQKAQRGFGKRAEKESDATKLTFYGLFKQATVGDINIPKPWALDRVGRAKWSAWDQVKGLTQEEAKKRYVDAYAALP